MASDQQPSLADFAFFSLAGQYYIAARFSARAGLSPVAGNLFHHAIEALLKGHLARTHTLPQLKRFGHKLGACWAAVKASLPQPNLDEFDRLIAELDRFEEVRYPDRVLETGMMTSISWSGHPVSVVTGHDGRELPRYDLIIPDLDRLVGELFRVCSINPQHVFALISSEGRAAVVDDNLASKGWFPGAAGAG